MTEKKISATEPTLEQNNQRLVCGIIMPISALDGCNELHWAEVQQIISESIDAAGFNGNIVSNADDATLIHKTILQNLYDNPIAICDVSGKNPNVMFELGLRLAFDKPTIIIKDDNTSYSFDTSGIEHLEYPRDLRFSKIVDFKKKLTDKIAATFKRAKEDPNYTSFLKHFGEFKVAKLDKREVSGEEILIDEIRALRQQMRRSEKYSNFENPYAYRNYQDKFKKPAKGDLYICMRDKSNEEIKQIAHMALLHPGVKQTTMDEISPNHFHLFLDISNDANIEEIEKHLGRKCIPSK